MEIPKLAIIQQKILKNPTSIFNSLEFVSNDDKLLYSVQNRICVWTFTDEGIQKFRIRCQDGCDVVKVISSSRVAYSNNKNCNLAMIDYGKIEKVRLFEGHTARINSVSIFTDGIANFLMTSSEDCKVKMWDQRERNEIANLSFASVPITAYHPNGLLFALGLDSHIMELYDLYDISKRLHYFKVEKSRAVEWRQLKFSNDGKYIVVTTNSSQVLIFDGTNALLLQNFKNFQNTSGDFVATDFDQYGRFLSIGSSDGRLHIWNVEKGEHICVYRCQSSLVKFISFSPTISMIATAGDGVMSLWRETFDTET